jgi:hypothetical protein
MPGKDLRLLVGFDVPQFDEVVPSAGNKKPAVGAERYGMDPFRMTIEGSQTLGGFEIPKLYFAVCSSRNDLLPVRSDRYGANVIGMASIRAQAILFLRRGARLSATDARRRDPEYKR